MKTFLLVLLISFSAFSQNKPQIISLWQNGAPGFEHLKDQPEQAKDWWVKNIHNPSITAFFPAAGKANGTSVLIFPGGGHRELVFDAEGRDAAQFLNQLGITAFVLKYRLAREPDSPYMVGVHGKEDAQRAIRTIRDNAEKWGLNVDKLGVMGFSAGGEVAHWVAYDSGADTLHKVDAIDAINAKPNFQILIYPGPSGVPDIIPADAPPAFVLTANDDPCCSGPSFKILEGYRKAGLPIEAHFYSKGGHGFNMGYRSTLKTLSGWPARLADWLVDTGLGFNSK